MTKPDVGTQVIGHPATSVNAPALMRSTAGGAYSDVVPDGSEYQTALQQQEHQHVTEQMSNLSCGGEC